MVVFIEHNMNDFALRSAKYIARRGAERREMIFMDTYKVVFYQNENGDCPVADFLNSLTGNVQIAMMHQLDFLELYGGECDGSPVRAVGDELYEVRSPQWRDVSHVLLFFDDSNIVLTHGFQNQSHRIPDSEIQRAKEIRGDYLARISDKSVAGCGEQLEVRPTRGPLWRPELDAILSCATKRSMDTMGAGPYEMELTRN